MALRTALETNKMVVAAVLLFAGWMAITALQVFETMNAVTLGNEVIGQGGMSGVIGLLVMAGTGGLLLLLYSELGETDPAPEPFPPETGDRRS